MPPGELIQGADPSTQSEATAEEIQAEVAQGRKNGPRALARPLRSQLTLVQGGSASWT